MGMLDYLKGKLWKKSHVISENKVITNQVKSGEIDSVPFVEVSLQENMQDEQSYLENKYESLKELLAKNNKYLMPDFLPYEYNLNDLNQLMIQLEHEGKLSDYPERKQNELMAAVNKFVQKHLPEGAGFQEPYGYFAVVEYYLENEKDIKLVLIDESDRPYIQATVDKSSGRANFSYVGDYSNLPSPDFKEKLNVSAILYPSVDEKEKNNNIVIQIDKNRDGSFHSKSQKRMNVFER